MSPSVEPVDVTAALDALSLEQALLDAELANARVIDLTRRLLEAHAEVDRLRVQLEALERGELERVKAERDELAKFKAKLVGSRVYRLAGRLRRLPGVEALAGKVIGG